MEHRVILRCRRRITPNSDEPVQRTQLRARDVNLVVPDRLTVPRWRVNEKRDAEKGQGKNPIPTRHQTDDGPAARAVLFSNRLREFLLAHVGLENQFSILRRDLDFGAGLNVAAQNFFGQWIFEITLDRASHRSRAVIRVVTFFDHELMRQIIENDLHFLGLQANLHLLYLQIDNLEEVRFLERVEDGDLVEAIEEFGLKDTFGLIQNLFPHRIVIVTFTRRAETHP